MIIQPNPIIHISFLYIGKANMVEVTLKIGVMPPVVLGMTPKTFFQWCDDAANIAKPFIESLKDKLAKGELSDIKAELDTELWNRMMEDKDGKEN